MTSDYRKEVAIDPLVVLEDPADIDGVDRLAGILGDDLLDALSFLGADSEFSSMKTDCCVLFYTDPSSLPENYEYRLLCAETVITGIAHIVHPLDLRIR